MLSSQFRPQCGSSLVPGGPGGAVGPGVEGRVILRVRDVTPAGSQIVGPVVLSPVQDVLLLARLGLLVRIRIEAENKFVSNQA